MKDKDKGYQEYLVNIEKESFLKRKFFNVCKNNQKLLKFYYRITNISVKKLKIIPNIKNASSILDIGCGTGIVLFYVKDFLNRNIELYGVDIEKNPILPNDVKFCKSDIDIQPLPFKNESFDIIIANFIIEHLNNPQNLFKEAFRCLKKGGYFYCVTDYITTLFLPDFWNFYHDPTHIRPWTKKSLKTLSRMYEFEIVKLGLIRWWEFFPLLPIFPLLNLLTKSNFSFIPYELFGRVVYIICKKPLK